jgi:SAM-dependent methyltransferase
VLEASRRRIVNELPPRALVVDVGGWGEPFPRADWVVDLMPYETRGLYGLRPDATQERFTADTWVQRDICEPEPLPFDDDQFDFAVCSHTLEDVRDPIRVCRELSRIAKAGYVEVPSRLVEQAYGVEGPWAGWGHHRWLIDVVDGGLRFVHKPLVVHHARRYRLPPGYEELLTDEQRVTTLWWQGTLDAYEEVITSPHEADEYLGAFAAANRGLVSVTPVRRWLGPQSWLARYALPRLFHR